MRDYIAEKRRTDALSDLEKVLEDEKLLGEDGMIMEDGNVVMLKGQLYIADGNIPLNNKEILKERLKTMSVVATIKDITDDI